MTYNKSIILFILLAVACTTPNPNYRPPADADLSCHSPLECSAPTAVCDLSRGAGTGKCVQCTADQKAACTDNTPLCGADNTCRGCSAHSDCASTSNVCLPSGACSDGTNVAYVAPTGTDNPTCSKATPCATLQQAIGKQPFIKMSGATPGNVSININQPVTILADSGTKLTGGRTGSVVTVVGTSQLAIYDLEITGGANNGVVLPVDSKPTVSFHRVKILRNAGAGITTFGGTLNVFQSTIAGNDGGGINMSSATTFDIRNNFIVRNGTLVSANAGGVRAVPAGSSKFEFNTVVGNKALSTAVSSAGLACTSAIAAPYNLVFDNSLSGAVDEQIAVCGRDQSLRIEPPAGAGFKDPSNNDYHLTVSTAADLLDKVACNGNAKDIDGDDRPEGALCDYGADEYRPQP